MAGEMGAAQDVVGCQIVRRANMVIDVDGVEALLQGKRFDDAVDVGEESQ
jgi:hypothetical protein